MRSKASFVVGFLCVGLSAGCAAMPSDGPAPAGAEAELRPRICPAIAILCARGYRAKQLPNCRQVCVPDNGWECTSDDECTIYCITTPCPSGSCVGHRCVASDDPTSPCAAVLCEPGTHCEARGGRARCVPSTCPDGQSLNLATGECECTTIGLCVEGWTWDPVACECITPCALVRCAAGTHCEAIDGAAACVPDGPTEPSCFRTGCSGEVCSDENVLTVCIYRPEYACYDHATCERQPTGECGWTPTPELDACLAGAGAF